MPKDQFVEPLDRDRDFHPPWGPGMAVLWVFVVTVLTMCVALTAGELGLVKTTLPDGKADVDAMLWIASPLQIVGVLIIASRLRSNPLDALALRRPTRAIKFMAIALALMFALFIGMLAVLLVQEFVVSQGVDLPTDEGQQLNEQAVLRAGLLSSLLLTGVVVPIQEEMVFRGLLLLSFFKTRLWFWGAAFITSMLFAVLHNPTSLNVLIHAPYIVYGLVFAAALRYTGSLLVSIGVHAFKNSIAVLLICFA